MTDSDHEHTFLTVQGMADRYGLTKATIYGWIHSGTGPRSLKIGKHRRFRLSDVLAWENARASDRSADVVA